MTALLGGVVGFLVGAAIVYLLALAVAQRRRGGRVLTPARTPTRPPAPARLVPIGRPGMVVMPEVEVDPEKIDIGNIPRADERPE